MNDDTFLISIIFWKSSIDQVKESGIYGKWKNDLLNSNSNLKLLVKNVGPKLFDYNDLYLRNVEDVFFLLIIGVAISLAVCLLENYNFTKFYIIFNKILKFMLY